jgi:hypothetical protein
MIQKAKPEPRNPGVTVVAGVIAVTGIIFAVISFPTNLTDIIQVGYFAFAAFVTVLAVVTAAYGRVSVLEQLAKGLFRMIIG